MSLTDPYTLLHEMINLKRFFGAPINCVLTHTVSYNGEFCPLETYSVRVGLSLNIYGHISGKIRTSYYADVNIFQNIKKTSVFI